MAVDRDVRAAVGIMREIETIGDGKREVLFAELNVLLRFEGRSVKLAGTRERIGRHQDAEYQRIVCICRDHHGKTAKLRNLVKNSSVFIGNVLKRLGIVTESELENMRLKISVNLDHHREFFASAHGLWNVRLEIGIHLRRRSLAAGG